MNLVSLDWLRAEAAAQGLALTDQDLEAIRADVEKNKAALATIRPDKTQGLEPPCQFVHPTRRPVAGHPRSPARGA